MKLHLSLLSGWAGSRNLVDIEIILHNLLIFAISFDREGSLLLLIKCICFINAFIGFKFVVLNGTNLINYFIIKIHCLLVFKHNVKHLFNLVESN